MCDHRPAWSRPRRGGPAGDADGDQRRAALALRRWRAGQAAVNGLTDPVERAAYEWAIGLAVRHLPVDGTFAALVRAYRERGGPVDACLRAACLCGAPEGRLVASLVRGAAFWRRLQACLLQLGD